MSAHPSITKAEAYRLRRLGLIKSTMPPRLPDDVLREDLAALIQQVNREQDPIRREVLLGQIESLRRLLGIDAPKPFKKGNQ